MKNRIAKPNFLRSLLFFPILALLISFACCNTENLTEWQPPTRVSEVEIPDVHPDESSVIKIVSLKRLIEAGRQNPQNQEVINMYGLQRIEGYIIDEENQDILIFAKQVKNWPVTSIFDFIESLRNATDSTYSPYCSLEPSTEGINALNNYLNTTSADQFDANRASNLYGKQKCIVGGVAPKSSIASIMIEADYLMKKVSQGIVKLDSVKSTWDFLAESNYTAEMGMSRFWFNIEESNCPIFEQSDNWLRIKELPIIISTRSIGVDGNGNLVDMPGQDLLSIKFAEGFTKQFKNSTRKEENFAKLDNIYYLQALTETLYYKSLLTEDDTIFRYFTKIYPVTQTIDFPDQLESVISFKSIEKQVNGQSTISSFIISGGVDLFPNIPNSKFQQSKSDFINLKTINFIENELFKKEGITKTIIDLKNDNYQVNNLLPNLNKDVILQYNIGEELLTELKNVA